MCVFCHGTCVRACARSFLCVGRGAGACTRANAPSPSIVYPGHTFPSAPPPRPTGDAFRLSANLAAKYDSQCAAVFERLDVLGNGRIEASELTRACELLGLELPTHGRERMASAMLSFMGKVRAQANPSRALRVSCQCRAPALPHQSCGPAAATAARAPRSLPGSF